MSRQVKTPRAPVELSLSRATLPRPPAPPPKPTFCSGMAIGELAKVRRAWAQEHHQTGLTDDDLKQCFLAYGSYLQRLIARRVGYNDPDLPNQLLQEVFVRVQRSKGQYDPARGNELTYLLQVTSCVVVDYFRRTQKLASTKHAGETLDGLRARQHSTMEPARADALRESLRRAVEQLPDDLRNLAELKLRGLTLDQMAQLRNQPVGTIKSAWFRTLERLRGDPKLQSYAKS